VKVKSKRPYLLRALFEWIVDSELTPHILVAADDESVLVPRQYVSDSKIVLNVSPSAVRDLHFGDDYVMFNGRFDGAPLAVEVPVAFVLAIYAKETGEGMMFDAQESPAGVEVKGEAGMEADSKADSKDRDGKAKAGSASHLKIIK
jgi:stringent starvation protein B